MGKVAISVMWTKGTASPTPYEISDITIFFFYFFYFFFLGGGGGMFGPCFVVQYLVLFLDLQSSRWYTLLCLLMACAS